MNFESQPRPSNHTEYRAGVKSDQGNKNNKSNDILHPAAEMANCLWILNRTGAVSTVASLFEDKSYFRAESILRAYLHQEKAGTKTKKLKEPAKTSENKRQTSLKIFAFAFVFSSCE